MNAIDIVKEQAAAYDAGKSFAVVTIVQSDGSTPRSSGKMIVYPDGSSKGTVGCWLCAARATLAAAC